MYQQQNWNVLHMLSGSPNWLPNQWKQVMFGGRVGVGTPDVLLSPLISYTHVPSMFPVQKLTKTNKLEEKY